MNLSRHSFRLKLLVLNSSGPIVRYSPNYIIINTAEAVKDIYADAKHNNLQKAPLYTFLHDGAVSVNSAIDKTVHARKRRILSHGFSDQALKALEPYMINNVNIWLDALLDSDQEKADTWSKPRNMTQVANFLTFDVLGDLCFGKSFGLLTSSSQSWLPPLVMARTTLMNIVGPAFPGPYLQTAHLHVQ